MVEDSRDYVLDDVFGALAHPARRAIVERLAARGPATVMELATPFDVSLNAVSKHVKVLERACLVRREVLGREHWIRLDARRLAQASAWVDRYGAYWTGALDALERLVLEEQQHEESSMEPKNRGEADR